MSGRRSLRSLLYRTARLIGDVNAISRGPRATAKRIERKTLLRIMGGFINWLVGR
jgi:hypothetical protein